MSRKSSKRIASAERVTKIYWELVMKGVPVKNQVARVAQRIGYSPVGAARFLKRLGFLRSKKY